MDEAPETIGLVLGGLASRGLDDWAEAQTLEASIATHYVRADIAEKRIRELKYLLRQALDALENHEGNYKLEKDAAQHVGDIILALRKRLKEPPQ